MAVCQPFVIDAEGVQDGGLQIMHVNGIGDGMIYQLVRLADDSYSPRRCMSRPLTLTRALPLGFRSQYAGLRICLDLAMWSPVRSGVETGARSTVSGRAAG